MQPLTLRRLGRVARQISLARVLAVLAAVLGSTGVLAAGADAVVLNPNAGPVEVSSPDTGSILEFNVTNNGNGDESFRLIANIGVGGVDFAPAGVDNIGIDTGSQTVTASLDDVPGGLP